MANAPDSTDDILAVFLTTKLAKKWIGVDLDGTLAKNDGWKGIEHIGEPIQPMVDRVKNWLDEGKTVKIVTARAAETGDQFEKVMRVIYDWLEEQDLPKLEVTNAKDPGMTELWDDRAVQVVPNTGQRADGEKD